MYKEILAQITYRNKESFIHEVLSLYHWKYETVESLKEYLENLEKLLEQFEVLKMNVEDMLAYKKGDE